MRTGVGLLLAVCASLTAAAEGPRVDLVTIAGASRTGVLIEPAPDLVLLVDQEEVRLDWSEVLELRVRSAAEPPPEAEHPLRVELADGARFGATLIDGGEALEMRIRSGQTVRVQPGAVRAIVRAAASERGREMLEERLRDADRRTAVAVVERGDKQVELAGTLEELTADGIRFRWKDRTLAIPWERLAGVAPAPPAERGAPAAVTLHDGQRFAGRIEGGDDRAVVLASATLGRLSIAWDYVRAIDSRSPRVIYLSDLPAAYEFRPLFSKHWEFARDADLRGEPVLLAGRQLRKALTMHSASQLAFDIDRRFRVFAAEVGIIDAMGSRGDAHVAVYGDGRLLWEAENVRGGEPPRAVSVDVTGVRVLELLVNFGGDLDLSDHVAWGLPRVVR